MAISLVKDSNRVTAIGVTSNVDGSTVMGVKADPSAHTLFVSDGSTGSSFSSSNAQRDANRIPVLWGLSDANDGTIIPIYGDPATGSILVRSA